ncbi:hypothetical protein MLD38_017837 [Melastoma candidum]|uniref:Uncharacterized protein n=1 Tax=Melastoma candidum TaxID=119954 RepID=A0ACB9QSH1_9MYRT|nr:hypothetical protein MLD38_017837 [Melastoma candidum]
MEFRTLDVTLISAKDLKDVNTFSRMDVYAIATLNNDPRTSHKSPVDKDSGPSPRWNFPVKFSLDEPSLQAGRLYLSVRLVSDRKLGDKHIGEVTIPVKELLDTSDKSGPRTVSYAVRLPSGKSKGTLEFSYAFGEKYTVQAPQAPPPPMMHQHEQQPKKLGEEPVTAYPAAYGAPSSSAYPAAYAQAPPPQGYAAYPPQGYAPPAAGVPVRLRCIPSAASGTVRGIPSAAGVSIRVPETTKEEAWQHGPWYSWRPAGRPLDR